MKRTLIFICTLLLCKCIHAGEALENLREPRTGLLSTQGPATMTMADPLSATLLQEHLSLPSTPARTMSKLCCSIRCCGIPCCTITKIYTQKKASH